MTHMTKAAFAIFTMTTVLANPQTALAETIAAGKWSSLSCELRPGPTYIKRDIEIRDDGNWSGTFSYFFDAGCTVPTMAFSADGPYEVLDTETLAGARDVNFIIAEADIEVQETNTAGFLNSGAAGSCGAEEWAVGLRQSITATGCAVIGMTLPVTEHEVVMVRDDYLFFGARPLDGSGLSTPESRPTALQVPMVRAN